MRLHFGTNLDRERLFDVFLTLMREIESQHIRADLYLGGSFLTRKFKPSDVDVAVDLRRLPKEGVSVATVFKIANSLQYLGLHFLPVFSQARNFVDLLQNMKPVDAAMRNAPERHLKGILKVS